MSINQLYRIAERIKTWVVGIWASYTAGLITESLSESRTPKEVLRTMTNISRLSIAVFWVGAVVVIIVWAVYFICDKISMAQVPTVRFQKIMKEHTCPMLNRAEYPGYSWGYNKNLVVPRNPSGWKPQDILINGAGSRVDIDYVFPDHNVILEGYTQNDFLNFCEHSADVQAARDRGDDRNRYAVYSFKLNSARKADNQKVEISLRKTKWSQLQFSWHELRRLDKHNKPVVKPSKDEAIEKLYLEAFGGNELLINSFCLHLILISSNNRAILSRISRTKSNDYPETWAATIGEQIEYEDFIDEQNKNIRPDFVVRWVKRALKEEFDINEDDITDRGRNELEEYVDMSSLRVLSLDMEGDIYNVALTCSVKLKINAEQLNKIKGVIIDGNEMKTEFRECSMADIRKILLNYPKNSKEYHPSTYLRLLMYHLSLERVDNTCKYIAKDEGSRRS